MHHVVALTLFIRHSDNGTMGSVRATRTNLLSVALLLFGTAAAAIGFVSMSIFDHTPGSHGSPPPVWPEASTITFSKESATLIMAIHGGCPCSRSSLDELLLVLAKAPRRVAPHILVITPIQMTSADLDGGLRDRLASFKNAQIHYDREGKEAEILGLQTSGHVLLYEPNRHLAFSGGITAARGYSGANASQEALMSAIANAPQETVNSPVFGCALQDSETGHTMGGGDTTLAPL